MVPLKTSSGQLISVSWRCRGGSLSSEGFEPPHYVVLKLLLTELRVCSVPNDALTRAGTMVSKRPAVVRSGVYTDKKSFFSFVQASHTTTVEMVENAEIYLEAAYKCVYSRGKKVRRTYGAGHLIAYRVTVENGMWVYF